MAVTASLTGGASYSFTIAADPPLPSVTSLQVPVANTAGDWMVCCVTWRQSIAGSNASVSVGDDTSNYWFPLGIPNGTSGSAGVTRSAIWVAPAAFAAKFVTVSPTGAVTAIAANVYDVAGMSKYFTLGGIGAGQTIGTSITGTLAAPASQAIVFTMAGASTHTATINLATGAGWGTVTRQVTTNGIDVLSDLTVASAFQVTTGSTSGHWTSTSSTDLSSVIGSAITVVSAPAQVNANWPVTVVEIAPGAGATTNVDQLTWVPVTGQTMSLDVTQGRQYQLAALNTGAGTADLDNVSGSLIPPGTGSFTGIDSGCPFRMRMIWPSSATPYMVPFSGYIQKWPQQWDPETQRGITSVALVDAWNYVNGNLQPILIQEILNDAPLYYWPMTDAGSSGQASNLANGQAAPLFVTRSKFGAGNNTEGFGQNSAGLLGAQGTLLLTSSVREQAQSGMWGQTLATATNTTQGYSLTINTGSFPLITNGLTIEWWFQIAAPFQTGSLLSRICDVSNINGSGWNVFVGQPSPAGAGQLFFDASGPNTTGSFVTMSTANYQQNGVGMTHCAVTFTRTTYTLYVNGQITAQGSFATTLNRRITTISFNGLAGTPDEALLGNFSESFYSGFTAHAAIFSGALSPGRIATHYNAGINAMTGDSASARIERLMQGGGYLGPRVILQDTGDAVTPMASCQDVSGQPAAGSITNIVQSTVPSILAVASTGDLVYRAKQDAYNQSVQWVLGDKPSLGELPYSPQDFLVDYDPTRIINDVQLTQLDNQDIVLPAASIGSAASQAQYGDCTYWATGYCEGDLTSPLTFGPGLLDLANWIGASNLKPTLRPASVTVDAASFPIAWPFVGQVQPGDIVTVNRRPPTAANLVLSFTGRVSQVARTINQGLGESTATCTVMIDPVPELFALTADDSTRGQLNGTNVLAWG